MCPEVLRRFLALTLAFQRLLSSQQGPAIQASREESSRPEQGGSLRMDQRWVFYMQSVLAFDSSHFADG